MVKQRRRLCFNLLSEPRRQRCFLWLFIWLLAACNGRTCSANMSDQRLCLLRWLIKISLARITSRRRHPINPDSSVFSSSSRRKRNSTCRVIPVLNPKTHTHTHTWSVKYFADVYSSAQITNSLRDICNFFRDFFLLVVHTPDRSVCRWNVRIIIGRFIPKKEKRERKRRIYKAGQFFPRCAISRR